MEILIILNDPPYGTERCYNALRLALSLLKNGATSKITVFLMADSVVAARTGQKTPDGYYNVERMLKRITATQGDVLLCGTCMDTRGLDADDLIAHARRSNMDELTGLTINADKVMVF